MPSLRDPNSLETDEIQRAYLQYIGWLAVLSDPDSPFARHLHGRINTAHDISRIAVLSVTGAIDGLKGVAIAAGQGKVEGRPDEATFTNLKRNMLLPVNALFVAQPERIALIGNTAIAALRPLPPAKDIATYELFCSDGAYPNVLLSVLMGGIGLNVHFDNIAEKIEPLALRSIAGQQDNKPFSLSLVSR